MNLASKVETKGKQVTGVNFITVIHFREVIGIALSIFSPRCFVTKIVNFVDRPCQNTVLVGAGTSSGISIGITMMLSFIFINHEIFEVLKKLWLSWVAFVHLIIGSSD